MSTVRINNSEILYSAFESFRYDKNLECLVIVTTSGKEHFKDVKDEEEAKKHITHILQNLEIYNSM